MQSNVLRTLATTYIAISLFVFTPSIYGANIPDEVNALVFHGKKFSTPVAIRLPVDETASYLETKSRYTNKIVGIPPVGLGRELSRTDKKLLSFLIQNDYLKTSIFNVTSRSSTQTFEFILYTDKLKKLAKKSLRGELNMGERKIKSIDFINDRVATPRGIKTRFIAIKFSYTLEKILSDLPNIKTVFKGRAKLHLDPDFNEWKLDDIRLDDRGGTEYLQAIKARYEPFISEIKRREAQRKENIANANDLIIGIWLTDGNDNTKLNGDKVVYELGGNGIYMKKGGKYFPFKWTIDGHSLITTYDHHKDASHCSILEISPSSITHKCNRIITKLSKVRIELENIYFSECNSTSGCKQYLEKYPNGRYIEKARIKMEDIYFSECNSIPDCNQYIEKYPNGRYLEKIKNKLEDIYFSKCDTILGCREYIKLYRNGKYITAPQVKRAKNILPTIDYSLSKTLQGHSKSVNSIAIAEGKIISGSEDRTIRIWDLQTAELLKTLNFNEKRTRKPPSVVVADGRILSLSSDKTIRIWDLQTAELLTTLNSHERRPRDVYYVTAADNRILSVSAGNTIRVWSLETGELLKTLEYHQGTFASIYVAVAEGKILSFFTDGTVRIWDLQTFELLKRFKLKGTLRPDFSNPINSVLVTERRFFLGFGKWLGIWDIETGKLLKAKKNTCGVVYSIVIAEEKIIYGNSCKEIVVSNMVTGETLKTFKGNSSTVPLIVGDGKIISVDGPTIKIWGLETGELLKTLEGHSSEILAIATLDDNKIVSASRDSTIKIWETSKRSNQNSKIERREAQRGEDIVNANDLIIGTWIINSSSDGKSNGAKVVYKLGGDGELYTKNDGRHFPFKWTMSGDVLTVNFYQLKQIQNCRVLEISSSSLTEKCGGIITKSSKVAN